MNGLNDLKRSNMKAIEILSKYGTVITCKVIKEQVVTIVLSRRETTKRDFIEKLTAGQKQLVLIVLDSNGNYWYFGQVEGAYVTAITGGSGTAKADANGYTITLTAMEADQAYQVDPTIVSGLL